MIRKFHLLPVFLFLLFVSLLHAQRSELAPRLGLEGATVHLQVFDVVKGSAAEQGGLKQGDQMMIFDGQPLATGTQLLGVIGTAAPGRHDVTVLREGKLTQLELVLGPAGATRLGVAFVSGVRVEQVQSGSPAALLGLQRGDLLTSLRFNGNVLPCATVQELIRVSSALPAAQPVEVLYQRGRTSAMSLLTLSSQPTADPATIQAASSAQAAAPAQAAPMRRGAPAASDAAAPVASAPVNGREALMQERLAKIQAAQGAASDRMNMRMRGAAAGASSNSAGAAQRNTTLEQMLTRTSYAPPAALARRMKEMNVLKYAFMNRKSGEVIFVGAYDPTYATGPIPYNALLADALENPYPRFTLEYPGSGPGSPLARARAALDQEFAHIARDPNYGVEWLGKLVLPVLRGDSADPDQQAALNAKLKAVGISPESYRAYMKWQLSKFEDMQAYNEGAKDFLPSVFASVGRSSKTGAEITAYRVFATQMNREALDSWCEVAGYRDLELQIDQRIRETGNRKLASQELLPVLYGSILRGLGISERQLSQILASYRSSGDEGLLVRPLEEGYQQIFKQVLMDRVVNGMSFTGATLARQYSLPALQSTLNTYGARRDSPVMQVFFQADYILKFMTSSARPAETIATHQSSQNYLAAAEHRAGNAAGRTPNSGVIRYWLYPQSVQMDVLSDNAGVRFRNASVRVGVESMQMEGADRTGSDFYLSTLQQYSNQLTANYEQYARIYPALHTLRETEKIVALARWARKNSLTVRVQAEGAPAAALPASADGFWGMTYIVRPSGSTDTMVTWAQGGVDFGQQNGEGWLQAGPPDRQATDDALRSLAASTVLSERAAAAAIGGDLESARDLAERGAQAMSGNIDFSNLPAVPMPVSAGFDPASVAEVSQASLEAVDKSMQVMQQASQDQAQAASLSASDPARAAQLAQQAQQARTNSGSELARLQGMLQEYRNKPETGQQVAVDLRHLDPNKPATVVTVPTPPPAVVLPQTASTVPLKPAGPAAPRGTLASKVPPLPGTEKPLEYRQQGNGLVGGTTWIYGFNVPPGSSDEMRARAEAGLLLQMKLAGETENTFIDTKGYNFILGTGVTQSLTLGEASRVYADDTTMGQHTAQQQALYASIRGRQFDRLDCHSNGAMICLAALSNEDAKAGHIRLFGPQITEESLREWQRLINEGKIKDVQVYINRGDPVPVTSYLRTNLTDVGKIGDNDAMAAEIERIAPGIHVQVNDGCLAKGDVVDLACHSMKQYQTIVDTPR